MESNPVERFPERYSELYEPSMRRRIIEPVRDLAVSLMSPLASAAYHIRYARVNHVRFVYYHFVFGDQASRFAEHLRFYRDNYRVISHSEAISRLRDGRVDDRYLSISFDDGFKNNAEVAAPILEQFGMPAIFFVVANLMKFGRGEESELESFSRSRFGHRPLRNMDRDDLRRLLAGGHEIGSHTLSHARLSNTTLAVAEREIVQSRTVLEEMTGSPVKHFCFPYGLAADFPAHCRDMVKRAGYQSCVSAIRGANKAGADVYHLRRDHIMANWPISQLKYFTRTNF